MLISRQPSFIFNRQATSWTNQNSISVTRGRGLITQPGRHRRSQTVRHPPPRLCCKPRRWREKQEKRTSEGFPRSNESPICPRGFTTHAALIKSRSGCLPRKQITMIIPNCHPLTVLKHPSIKSPFQLFSPPKQRSLLLSVMCHYSHCFALCAHFNHHDVSSVCRRGWRRRTTPWPALTWKRRETHSRCCLVAGSDRTHLRGPFLNFDPTVGRQSGTVVSVGQGNLPVNR